MGECGRLECGLLEMAMATASDATGGDQTASWRTGLVVNNSIRKEKVPFVIKDGFRNGEWGFDRFADESHSFVAVR